MNKYDNKEKYRYTFKTKKKRRRNHLNLSSSSMHKNYSKLCVIILKHACPFSKLSYFCLYMNKILHKSCLLITRFPSHSDSGKKTNKRLL